MLVGWVCVCCCIAVRPLIHPLAASTVAGAFASKTSRFSSCTILHYLYRLNNCCRWNVCSYHYSMIDPSPKAMPRCGVIRWKVVVLLVFAAVFYESPKSGCIAVMGIITHQTRNTSREISFRVSKYIICQVICMIPSFQGQIELCGVSYADKGLPTTSPETF